MEKTERKLCSIGEQIRGIAMQSRSQSRLCPFPLRLHSTASAARAETLSDALGTRLIAMVSERDFDNVT